MIIVKREIDVVRRSFKGVFFNCFFCFLVGSVRVFSRNFFKGGFREYWISFI